MNYRIAMRLIQETHLKHWGEFARELPRLDTLTQPQAQEILLAHANMMKEAAEKNMFLPSEMFRFFQEYDVVCLLLLLCTMGGINKEVPITESDIANVDVDMSNFHCFGVGGEGVIGTIKEVIRRGQCNQLPPPVAQLLPTQE